MIASFVKKEYKIMFSLPKYYVITTFNIDKYSIREQVFIKLYMFFQTFELTVK